MSDKERIKALKHELKLSQKALLFHVKENKQLKKHIKHLEENYV